MDRNMAKKLSTASLRNFKKQPEIEKSGKIDEVMEAGKRILVQVAKEPISPKAAFNY